MIIAIGGVSRAGKSTLSELLQEQFGSLGQSVAIVEQDKYVFKEKDLPKIKSKVDWESPKSIDYSKFRKAIIAASKKHDHVIAEGLLVFFDKSLNKLFDKNVFIEIPKYLFIERKKIDLRWGSTPEPKWYIDHIWSSYKKYGKLNLPADFLKLSGKSKFDLSKVMDFLIDTTEEENLFNNIADKYAADYKHVARGPMMSSPGIRYKNKNFAFFHKNEMTFKLGKTFNAKANGIRKVKYLSPFKTKPPLKAWYIISGEQKDLWENLTSLAFEYIQQEVK